MVVPVAEREIAAPLGLIGGDVALSTFVAADAGMALAATASGGAAVGLISGGRAIAEDAAVDSSSVGSAAKTAPEAVEGSSRVFVGTLRGTIYDTPEGWVHRVADNGKGSVYQRAGAEGNADMIRIMEPTARYPLGYARVYNSGGQPVDVFGKPGPPATTHIPESYRGPWPGWPQ